MLTLKQLIQAIQRDQSLKKSDDSGSFPRSPDVLEVTMRPIYFTARLALGTLVFGEVCGQATFYDLDAKVAVFEDRAGQLIMTEVTIGDLSDIKKDF